MRISQNAVVGLIDRRAVARLRGCVIADTRGTQHSARGVSSSISVGGKACDGARSGYVAVENARVFGCGDDIADVGEPFGRPNVA